MQNQFKLTDNPQEIQINDLRIPFPRELGVKPDEFVTQANELLNKHGVEFPSGFSAVVEGERYTVKKGVKHPTSIKDFEKQEARINHVRKLPPFFINCLRLEHKFKIDAGKFLKDLIGKSYEEGLLHNGSLLVVALSYVEQKYPLELWPSGEQVTNPDLSIKGIKGDVKYITEADFFGRIFKEDQGKIYFANKGLRLQRDLRVGDDVCFDIGRFISSRCYDGIRQADMLFADCSEKDLRDLKSWGHSKPESLPVPRACRVVFFSWSMYTNLIENAYFIDFSKRLWSEIKTCAKIYRVGAEFLSVSPMEGRSAH
jgi:hypothetical protein